jgi:DNA-binding NarL/FixJ family response regulator
MKPTAVIVDDSSTMRKAIAMALGRAGVTVVAEGASGKDALPLYELHRPTLMTLDIVLPEMDGVTAAGLLLSKHPGAALVVCSSLSSREKILACRDAGVAHFLLKPFTPEKVVEVVQTILARRMPVTPKATCEEIRV